MNTFLNVVASLALYSFSMVMAVYAVIKIFDFIARFEKCSRAERRLARLSKTDRS
jgi:hypothetical protein